MSWDDLRLVLALARGGTIAAAARSLAIDPTTVSRRLRAFEQSLGAAVFARADGRLSPTDLGTRLIERAERMETQALAIQEEARAGTARCEGSVRVTAVPLLANRLLIPAAPRLLERHPGLRLEIVADDRNASFGRRETDVALRLARPLDSTAHCRRIGRLSYSVYGRADGSTESWIAYDQAHDHLPQARWMAALPMAEDARLHVNDAEGLLRAALAGLGLAVLPDMVGRHEPLLRRVEHLGRPPAREIWLLVHRDLRALRRIQVVGEWLAGLCREMEAGASKDRSLDVMTEPASTRHAEPFAG